MAARQLLKVSLAEQGSWPNKDVAFSRWRAAVERTGVVVVQADLPFDDVRAFSVIGDPPAIVINEHDWTASKVFSLFHEYGHVLWGYEGICSPLDAGLASSSIEKACDLFAGMLLVPPDGLLDNQVVRSMGARLGSIAAGDLARIAATYNVSVMVIWYRLRQTGLISASAFSDRWGEWRRPRRQISKARRPKIPAWSKAKRRLGSSLGTELIRAEESGKISIADALASLEIRLEDLDTLRSAFG
jgi:Zn-dependent peptidase ImmA (M78 family)